MPRNGRVYGKISNYNALDAGVWESWSTGSLYCALFSSSKILYVAPTVSKFDKVFIIKDKPLNTPEHSLLEKNGKGPLYC